MQAAEASRNGVMTCWTNSIVRQTPVALPNIFTYLCRVLNANAEMNPTFSSIRKQIPTCPDNAEAQKKAERNPADRCGAVSPDCPIRNILSRIGDKWSMLVLYTLSHHDRLRFCELLRAIPDISQKMLTVTLRTLEQDGLLHRQVYAEVPPRVEYRLTELGESLMPRVQMLVDWALEHMSEIMKHREVMAK